jgi:hypothetical protein
MYNSLNDLFPFLIAKRQLTDQGIDSTPPGLLMGLMPGMKVPMLQQVILNKAVVDGEIAIKEKDLVIAGKGTSDQKISDLKTAIVELSSKLGTSPAAELLAAVNKLRSLVGLDPILASTNP